MKNEMNSRVAFSGAVAGHWAKILLACLAIFLLAGCSKEKPIKLGFVGGLSGAAADLGLSSRDGVLLAIEKRNATGGIRGRKIELLIRDDENNPDVAKKAVQSLLDEGVVAIIGPDTSNMAVAAAPVAEAGKTVMISPTVTTRELSGKYQYFFRVIQATDKYATKKALFRRHVLKENRVAVAYDIRNRAYSENWLEDFRKAFEGDGGRLAAVVGFDSGGSSRLEDIAPRLLAGRPDGILIIANAHDTATLSRAIRKLNTSVNLGTSEWGATEKLVELGGKAVEGIYSSQFIDRNSKNPEYVAFRDEYERRYGKKPGFGGVLGHDAATVILDALQKNTQREYLDETILSIGAFVGLQGAMRFNAHRETSRTSYITTILNGQFQTYEN